MIIASIILFFNPSLLKQLRSTGSRKFKNFIMSYIINGLRKNWFDLMSVEK